MDSTSKSKPNKKEIKPNKSSRIKWTENAVKALLCCLLENKERLEDLKYTCRATSNPEGIQLWSDAEAFLLIYNFEQSYSNV